MITNKKIGNNFATSKRQKNFNLNLKKIQFSFHSTIKMTLMVVVVVFLFFIIIIIITETKKKKNQVNAIFPTTGLSSLLWRKCFRSQPMNKSNQIKNLQQKLKNKSSSSVKKKIIGN